jgi:hypothetical protein
MIAPAGPMTYNAANTAGGRMAHMRPTVYSSGKER